MFFVAILFGFLWVTCSLLEMVDQLSLNVHKIVLTIDFAIAPFVAYWFVLFCAHFPNRNKNLTLIKEALLLIPIIAVSWLGLSGRVIDIVGKNWGIYNKKIYLLYFFVIFLYFIVFTLILFLKKYKNSTPIEKNQLRYIISGYYISLSSALFASAYNGLVHRFENVTFTILVSITLLFALMSSYAMARYRLFDIKVVIRKGIIFSVSLIITLALYTYIALAFKDSIEKYWNVSTAWTAVILVGLVALGFPVLKSLIEKSVNIVFKGKKSIDLAVKELREQISQKKDLDALLEVISRDIRRFLGVEWVKMFIVNHKDKHYSYSTDVDIEIIEPGNDLLRYFEKYQTVVIYDELSHLIEDQSGQFEKEMLQRVEKELKKRHASLAMPFKTEDEVYGMVFLGKREDDAPYSVQDVQYLEQLREQVNFTLASAVLYRDAMERIRLQAGEEV